MRPDTDTYFLQMATLTATRSTCPRRHVGCIVVDKHNYVLGTGRNGVPRGIPHCDKFPCGGQSHISGEGLDVCLATHAELNAILQCRDPQAIHTVYTSTSPCIHCIKVIMNTSAKRIVFSEEYSDKSAKRLWMKVNGYSSWVLHKGEL